MSRFANMRYAKEWQFYHEFFSSLAKKDGWLAPMLHIFEGIASMPQCKDLLPRTSNHVSLCLQAKVRGPYFYPKIYVTPRRNLTWQCALHTKWEDIVLESDPPGVLANFQELLPRLLNEPMEFYDSQFDSTLEMGNSIRMKHDQ